MNEKYQPLAHKLRPEAFAQVIGQDHLFGEAGVLSNIESSKNSPSMILWGPAGVGKTTIAKIIAKVTDSNFEMISAVESNSAEIRKKIEKIKAANDSSDLLASQNDGKKTIMMVDEIHHFNKTQQDLFLPFIEDGTIILIGTTTENPSFALNSAILSRCKVVTLNPLCEQSMTQLLQKSEEFLQQKIPVNDEARQLLVNSAGGDARYFLNICEELHNFVQDKQDQEISAQKLMQIINKRAAHFDNKGEFHYNLISAFHKSLRGSDVDAALYYLARMMVAGQDPHYILRRLARFATEDIGLADPNALLQVMACKENYDFLGSPEGDYALSHATIYCATAPKSNASYKAHKAAIVAAKESTHLNPPKHILNAPTKMMKGQGYNEGYIYDHDTKDCFSGQEYFPDELVVNRPEFYQPNLRGNEREIKKRINYWQKIKKMRQDS